MCVEGETEKKTLISCNYKEITFTYIKPEAKIEILDFKPFPRPVQRWKP